MEAPYISKLQVSKPWLSVFLVDGAWVRKNYNVDFVYGGHDLVYNFIPKREIWLDSSVEVKERPFTLLHELYERHRMDSLGETYDVAHEFAAALEKKYRKDPTGIHEKIKELFDLHKTESEKKVAYQLGFKLALHDAGFKEEPTFPTHKNPGPVAKEPTSPITSTPKQDSTVTSIVSPKTY